MHEIATKQPQPGALHLSHTVARDFIQVLAILLTQSHMFPRYHHGSPPMMPQHTFSHYCPAIFCPSCLMSLTQTWLIPILPLYQTSTDLSSFCLETTQISCICHSFYSLPMTQNQPNSEVISGAIDATVAAYNCFYKPVLTLIKD